MTGSSQIAVLLIEDDEDDYVRIQNMLADVSPARYRLEWAASREAALEVMGKNHHDVFLLDYHLGARNGLELLQEVNASRLRGPIILLTGEEDHLEDISGMGLKANTRERTARLRRHWLSGRCSIAPCGRSLRPRFAHMLRRIPAKNAHKGLCYSSITGIGLKAGVSDCLAKGSLSPPLLDRSIRYAILNNNLREQLRASDELFDQLAENIHMVFWVLSLEGDKIIHVNHAYETVWKRSRGSLFARPRSWLDAVHPEDRGRMVSAFSGLGPESCGIHEYRIVNPDSSVRWIRDRSFPVKNESGKVYRIARISEDVTEDKRLRREAEYSRQQILQAEKLASLGELVAGVAHEINNPSSFISYNLPLLEESWQAVEPILLDYAAAHPDWETGAVGLDELCRDMREIIEAIRIGSDRINKVVTNLKDFARTDEGSHTEPVRVNDVVEKTLTIVGAQLRKFASRIDVDLARDLPVVDGHLYKLEQVVANLLINAAQSISERSAGRISIATRYVERLRSVLIEIEDNGRGMDREALSRLFEPFFTTRRASGGTGLGLSVSYRLVREHGGRIGILSRPGLGTRFTVFLPTEGGSTLQLSPMVLCVDDDLAFLNMLKTIFLKVNADADTLDNAEGVLAYIEDHPEVDIVLSDLVMPSMDGWELLKRIKARFPLLPFILYTGSLNALEDRPEGMAQPDCFLEKPFTVKQLIHIIDRIGRQRL